MRNQLIKLSEKEIVYLNSFVKRRLKNLCSSDIMEDRLTDKINYIFTNTLGKNFTSNEIKDFVDELKQINKLVRQSV